ncbi:hypothetical protein T265_10682 [Opisthorchis viverrini]|uniref:Uncharacterized protein n=1 Tax=Opisthorchis viverrini TaxID=6198 RepID=A0A074Z1C1_OPIVI|nr:hypothetical protein T265_10682 [Opisthorchis viverrini]KER20856.1 hypothetical protein T265_10682 [Opisthorchis viverrini]
MAQTALSAEEFQRFQSQLLDLREANIEANERRLRAEARVRQLESELLSAQKFADSHNHDRTRMEEMERENKHLREKIQGTEAAFQLQSSTLRAECHHLTAELTKLQQSLNKPRQTQGCQTISVPLTSVSAQTIDRLSDALDSEPLSLQEVAELRTALDISNASQAIYRLATQTLSDKLSELEAMVCGDVARLHAQLGEMRLERACLLDKLDQAHHFVKEAEDAQRELRTQLELQRIRGEKVHRELRRQLTRLVRSHQLESAEQSSLRKSSIYSSSSSLSSAVTPIPGASLTNGECSSLHPETPPPLDTSEAKRLEVPPGFFSLADFKALVDRLSEVQEENCVFRRHIQRLESEVVSKSKALQMELDKCIHGSSSSPSFCSPVSTARFDPTHHSVGPHPIGNSFSWFSSLKSAVAPGLTTNQHGISSTHLESINRLKRMCEQLVTENVQLTEELEKLRAKA